MADGFMPVSAGPVEVVLAPEPFTTRVERLEAKAGATVAEILTEACRLGALDPQDLCRAEVFLDGVHLADRAAALEVRPSSGQMLNIAVLPQGGGGGGNKVLTTILEVALIAATAWIAGPASLGAFSLAGATGLQGVALAAVRFGALAAVSLGGSEILQALNKPASGPQQHYDLETQSNQARRGQPMPLCLGRRRWAFDLASSAYSSFGEDDTFVTAIYALHYGPCTLTDVKIGETLISAYPSDEIQTEMFLEPGPRTSTLYPKAVHQDSFQTQLDRPHGNYATETTVEDAATAELDFYWPGGLYFPKTDGSTTNCDQTLYIEISPYGANSWTTAPGAPVQLSKNQKAPFRKTVTITFATAGKYDVRVKRNIKAPTDRDVDDVLWTAMRTPRPGKPVLDENLSILVVRAKASQDFSGTLGVVSGIVEPRVPIWNGVNAWQGDPTTYDATNWQPSSNPIELLRYVMTGYPAAKPLAADEIDASFGVQQQLIVDQDWGASVLVTGNESQQDIAKKLGAAGRFATFWNGSKLCVSPDWIKETPRQMFAGRNASGFRRTRNFPEPVHAIYVTFTNLDEDWKDDGLYVYNDGYDATNATLIETMALDFACSADRAHREGRVFLARRVDGVFAYEWTAGADALVATLGDRVRARRTSALYDQADARVLHRIWSGSLVAGVRLDVDFDMQTGVSYALDVRTPSKMIFGLGITSAVGTGRTVMFASPLAADQAPGKGDLVAIGRVDHVTEDVEIIDIDPQSDRTISIKARNYIGPSIEAAETGPIPPINTFLTAREGLPVPRIIGTSGSSDGAVVDFEIASQRTASIKGFSTRWRFTPGEGLSAGWNTLPLLGAGARTVRTPAVPDSQHERGDVTAEVRVDVEIRTVGNNGASSEPAQALAILIYQGAPAVDGFDAAGVKRTADDGSSYPAIHVVATARKAGEAQDLLVEIQKHGSSPEAWAPGGQPLPSANPTGDFTGVLPAAAYDVRARWRTVQGWLGEWARKDNVVIPSDSNVSGNTENVGHWKTVDLTAFIDTVTPLVEGAAAAATAATEQVAAANVVLDAAQAKIDEALDGDGLTSQAILQAAQALDDLRGLIDKVSYVGTDKITHVVAQAVGDISTSRALIDYNYTTLQAADAAQASATSVVSAAVAGNTGSIVTLNAAVVSQGSTLATLGSTVAANYGALSGQITSNYTALSTADAAAANAITGASTTLNGVTTSSYLTQQALTTLSGQAYGSLMLKTNSDGNLASLQLLSASGPVAVSTIRLEADNVLFCKAGVARPICYVNTVDNYLYTDYLRVGTANILDLSVNTLKVQNHAITFPLFYKNNDMTDISNGAEHQVSDGLLIGFTTSASSLIGTCYARVSNTDTSTGQDVLVRVVRDGSIQIGAADVHININNSASLSFPLQDDGLTGAHTYTVYVTTTPGTTASGKSVKVNEVSFQATRVSK